MHNPYEHVVHGTPQSMQMLIRNLPGPTLPAASALSRPLSRLQAGLKLEYVYGYAGKENTCQNLFFLADGRICYYTASVGVVYNPENHTQDFFQASGRLLSWHGAWQRRCLAEAFA